MADPNPRDPLLRYLREQRRLDADLNRILARAARDAERRVAALSLGRGGIGARVRQAQLTATLTAIREVQEQLWQEGVGPLIESSLPRAQEAAVKAAELMDNVLFASLPAAQAESLRVTARAMAEQGMITEANRQAVQLSARVYRNTELASGAVEATIRSGIIQGLSARELAGTVKIFIDPATPGGVSYAAKRLARTELNNAFHNRQIAAASNKPWVLGTKWNLSGSHPKADRCDELSKEDPDNLGTGVYRPDNVPDKPHPHCLCFLTYETMSVDAFLNDLASSLRMAA